MTAATVRVFTAVVVAKARARSGAVASSWAARSITGGPLSLNFVSTALSGAAEAAGVFTLDRFEAWTGAAGISGASPQINATAECSNQCLDMGKATRTLASRPTQVNNVCERV